MYYWFLTSSLLLVANVVYGRMLTCPPGEFVYRECSSCLSIQGTSQIFEEAMQVCTSKRGRLLEVAGDADFKRLNRYLEGIRETRKLWVGYRYSASSVRVTVEGGVASDVVLDDGNFGSGNGVNGSTTCIAVKEGRFFDTPCSNFLPFLCQYSHSVPQVMLSPDSSVVYFSNTTNTTLSAVVTGGNVTSIEWRRDGTALQGKVAVSNGSIMTYTVTIQSGTYNLVVTDRSGAFVVASWQVRQAVLGAITSPPGNLTVAPTQLAGFQCRTTSFSPPLRFTWFKDSTELQASGNRRIYIVPETGTLYIREVTASDAGNYHCLVSNAAGSVVSAAAQLTVVPVSELGKFQANYVFLPSNPSAIAGQSLVLDFLGRTDNLQGTATLILILPSLDRLKEPYQYPGNPNFPVFRLENITSEFDGKKLKCDFFSNGSPEIVKIAVLQVTVFAVANVDKLLTSWNGIESSDSLRSIPEGSAVSLLCNFSGSPAPTVEWYRDGVQTVEGVATDVSLSTLTVSGVQFTHSYQCVVSNKYGTSMASIIICSQPQAQVPGPVTFQVKSDSNSSLYVSWDEASFEGSIQELLRYDIQYRSKPGGDAGSRTELFDVRNVVLSGLQSNTDYEVTISASSLAGSGPVDTKTVSTFANVPTTPIPADSVTVSYSKDGGTLAVKWTAYLDGNQRLLSTVTYQLQYRFSGQDKGGPEQMKTVSGDENSLAIINGLSDAKNYEVRVRIVVQTQRSPPVFANGPWSDYVKTSGVIPARLDTVTSGSVATGGVSPFKGLTQKVIIIIVAVVAAVVIVGVVILAICCFCCYKRRGGVYSIPAAEQKQTKSIVSFDYSGNVTTVFSPSSPIASAQAPPTSHTASQEQLIAPASDSMSSNHKVTIAVVDTTSIDETKKHLSTSDSWTEEFDQLEGLVNTLKDTVTSMASLPQVSPSPDPLPPPKVTPPSLGHSLPSGVLVIDNPDAGSQGTLIVSDNVHPNDSIDEHVLQNHLSDQEDEEEEDDDSRSSSEEENGSSQILQGGVAKREDNFVPKVYGNKVLYPLQEDSSLSSSSSLDSESNKRKKSLTSNPAEGEDIRANFIELLQYGDEDDLHMV